MYNFVNMQEGKAGSAVSATVVRGQMLDKSYSRLLKAAAKTAVAEE